MDIEYQENKFRASIMLTTPYPGEMELLRTIYLKLMDNDDEKDKILEENEKLKQENKRLKEILKIKRKEIIKRVLALQEITDKYTNEVLFKNNVNPNDAVKQVLKEILSSKVI